MKVSLNVNSEAIAGVFDYLPDYHDIQSTPSLQETGAEVWYQTVRAEILAAFPDAEINSHSDYQGAHVLCDEDHPEIWAAREKAEAAAIESVRLEIEERTAGIED